MNQAHRLRADLAWTLLTLLAVLLWDLSGGDRAVSRHLADAGGFPWRNAWVTRDLMHEGGRWLSGLLLLGLVIDALRAAPARTGCPGAPDRPGRAERGAALVVVVMGLVLVPLLKRASDTSCPWDLSEFGGRADWVSHWQLGVVDGGPGHCFPSGHAVAAFAFLALYFLWRPYRPGVARWWLSGTLLAGALFGGAQVLRGAHFVSHVLWSGWICWALAVTCNFCSAWSAGAATTIPIWRRL